MVKQPIKNKGVYAKFDEEQAKERRKIIIVATITIVLILGLIAGVVYYGINSNKKSTKNPTIADGSTRVDEKTSDGDVSPAERDTTTTGTSGTTSGTDTSDPVAETTTRIADTGPADLLTLALSCGGLTTALGYLIERKKA